MKSRPRRFSHSLALLVAATWSSAAWASPLVNTTNYRLVNNNPTGSAPVTGITLLVTPSGTQSDPTVMPADPAQSPLTIASDSTGFVGTLQVGSGAVSLPSGKDNEVLNLAFSGGGFQPGGILNFSLQTNPALGTTPATLAVYYPTASSLSLVRLGPDPTKGDATPVSPSPSSPNGAVQVPEPMSMTLWAALSALGMVRAGLYRMRRKTPVLGSETPCPV